LLALFAKHAIASGVITLALKADNVPIDLSFGEWSKRELGLQLSALDAVKAAALRSKVLVVVDQLDALSLTVDWPAPQKLVQML
jgi:predicted GTPase